jgi:hypothetical protein
LYDVAPLVPSLPNEDTFHALAYKFYDFDYAEIKNSTLECFGTIGTDNGTAIIEIFEIATFEALPYETILPPEDPDDDVRWAHAVSPNGRAWDIYRVETRGGVQPYCDGRRYMTEKPYTAEYWFYYSGGNDLWTTGSGMKREILSDVADMPAFV